LSRLGINKTPKRFGIDLISNVPGSLIGSSIDATLKSETEKAIIFISTQLPFSVINESINKGLDHEINNTN